MKKKILGNTVKAILLCMVCIGIVSWVKRIDDGEKLTGSAGLGDLRSVIILVDSGVPIEPYGNKDSALCASLKWHYFEVAEFLIKRGHIPNIEIHHAVCHSLQDNMMPEKPLLDFAAMHHVDVSDCKTRLYSNLESR